MQAHTSSVLPEPDRRRLIAEHLRLARNAATRFARTHAAVEADELQAFGCIGLIQAARGYLPGQGKSFAAYAYPRVRGAILDGLASLMPVPRGCYRRHRGEFVHLNDERDYESVCHQPALARDDVHRHELRAALQVAIDRLPTMQRTLLYWHFTRDLSVAEAARKLGRSRSWGCRARAQAISALRHELAHLADEI